MSTGFVFFLVVVIFNIIRAAYKKQQQHPRRPVEERVAEPAQEAAYEPRATVVDEGEGRTLEGQEAPPLRPMSAGARGPAVQEQAHPQEPVRSRRRTAAQNLFEGHNIARAVVLKEILDEPRAKRPWKPTRR